MRIIRTFALAVFRGTLLLFVSFVPVLAQWATTNLSQARSHLGSTSLVNHNRVIFAGGLSGAVPNTFHATVDMYDLTGTLILTQQLSQARSDLGVTSLGTKAYFGGGRNGSGSSTVVDVYDINNGWGTPLALSQARAYLCAAAAGSKVIFAGGSSGPPTTRVDIFDTGNNNALTTTELSEARDQIAVGVVDSKVVFAGGHKGGNVYSNVIDIYDVNTGWVTHSLTLSQPRAFLSAATIGKKIFFGGGQSASGVSNVVDIVDLTNPNAPVLLPSITLPNARKYLSASSAGSKVIFAGGYNGGNTPLDFVDIYDTATSSWLPTDHLTQARGTLSATSLGSKIFFGGGSSGTSTAYNTVNIYDTETIPPVVDTFSPLDNATGVPVDADLVITFNEGIKKGSGNIVIKEGGVFVKNKAITDGDVTITNSNRTLTIPSPGFTSSSEVNIEIAAGVIKDLAGNNFAGITNATTWNFTTPKIVNFDSPAPILPGLLTKGSTMEKASITVDNPSKVSKVFFKSSFISDPGNTRTPVEIERNGNVYEKVFSAADRSDPIGLEYFFEVTDITLGKQSTDPKRAYIVYPEGHEGQQIPSLAAGTTESAYRIIAVPLKLDKDGVMDVFSDLVGEDQTYNKEKWRLYTYENGDNREFIKQPSFTKIEPGKGYWLIFREQTTINVGKGQTVPFNNEANDTPFKITLNPNAWTLIGNPYNFEVAWQDVLDSSPLGTTEKENIDQQVSVFEGGTTLVSRPVLKPFQGAFVRNSNSTAVELIVPVENTSGGRLASIQDEDVNLSAKNWQLPLTLTDGVLTNALGGIGMNSQATAKGKDRFDAVCVPLLEGMGMFEMAFAHPEANTDFSREIVPTAENYVWDFAINRTTDKPLTLTWNNSLIHDSEKQLFLYDPAHQIIKNMKAEDSYTVLPSSKNLRVFFGNADFVRHHMDEMLPVFNLPYPNPAINRVTIPFYVPADLEGIGMSIKVYTAQGAPLTTLTDDTYTKGSHEVVWETNGKSGLFLIHMKAGTMESKWAKVLVK